jgi:TorA maturation chaperone TorD
MAVEVSEGQLDGLTFVGQTLAPLFLEDPLADGAGVVLDAFASLEVTEAANEWPFVLPSEIEPSLEKMRKGASGDRAEASEAYRRLFIGPGRKEASPWGSVYTDRDGVMFGSAEIALHDWLSANGVSVSGGHALPDDHIGTMLQLMAWLAVQRPELVRTFLETHFLTWASHYLELLRSVSRHPLYEGLAEVTDATLSGVSSSLQLNVQPARFYR